MFYCFSTRIYESVILLKYGWKSERVWGRGVGVGDNMSGLVWVMEWTSVLVIILSIPKKQQQQQQQQQKTAKKIQENKEGEPRNKRSQTKFAVSLYYSEKKKQKKLTIHLLDFYRHFLLNREVRA